MHSATAMPYPYAPVLAGQHQFWQMPSTNSSTNAASWNRPLNPDVATTMNHSMYPFHMMMRQQQQQQSFLLGQRHHQCHQSQQTMATGAIQPAVANGKDSILRGDKSARAGVSDGARAGVEVAGELELEDDELASHPGQDPQQQGSGNIMEFSPSQLVLRDCSYSPSSTFKFGIDLLDFWGGEPGAHLQSGEVEKVSGMCAGISSSKCP